MRDPVVGGASERARKLRQAMPMAWPEEAQALEVVKDVPSSPWWIRITSYNVCYTKLLRRHSEHDLGHPIGLPPEGACE